MKPSSAAALVVVFAAILGAAAYHLLRQEGTPVKPSDADAAPNRGGGGPDLAMADPASREDAEPDEPDEPDEDLGPMRPTVVHVPGQGPIDPIDLTNLAPASFGAKPWFRIVFETEKWRDVWTTLHEADGPRQDPLEDPIGPPALKVGEEAILIVGLGERPRMDYAFKFEPVEPKFGEARYRLTITEMLIPPVEVVTRPARIYLVPTEPMKKVGLVIEDKEGYELARFDPPKD